MTKEEYLTKRKDMLRRQQKELFELAREYAMSNARYKVGDTVEDGLGRVIAESVEIYHSPYSLPSVSYWGKELKKDGKPFLNGRKRRVYECNLIR